MTITRETAHTPNMLRFISRDTDTDRVLECRITRERAAVLDQTGEADFCDGAVIAARWCNAGHTEAVIWAELERLHHERAAAATGPLLPDTPEHRALRDAADWCRFTETHGTPADRADAEDKHLDALRRVMRADT